MAQLVSAWPLMRDEFELFYQNIMTVINLVSKNIALILSVFHFFFLLSGNLHFNVTSKEHSHEIMDQLEPYVYQWTGNGPAPINKLFVFSFDVGVVS